MTGVIWWKNGDHPDDRVGEVADWHGTGEVYEKVEGAVVRFYRHPWTPGDRYHTGSDVTGERGCGRRWHDHGWIDQGEDGITVCPGGMVFTRPDGAYGVRKGHEMTDKTMGQIAFEAYRDAVDGKPIPDWDELHGDRLKVQGGWEAAAAAVQTATIDFLTKMSAEVAADPPVIRQAPTRWQPPGRPVGPEVYFGGPSGESTPSGGGEPPTGEPVAVEAGPDEG